ncbi:MAG: aminotransferase class V-fold PLP-dependent enzyme [Dehalococcoidales bacterium]|nr:aminotransferase class V-fold PLP-dependent enzyme [Dehalococcoidales bacterium]
MEKIVYLDNTATVYPKPKEVIDFMCQFYREKGVNPGRSGYDLCVEAGELVFETREMLTKLFNGADPNRLVFTYNASDSLNIIINGILEPGDHVITSNLEHNSVLRPIHHLYSEGIVEVDYVPFDNEGYIDPDDIRKKMKKNTKLVIISHASNVIGTVQPVGEIGKICRERSVIFAIDAAQTAGIIPIDIEAMNIDIVAFTGHKSLLGPTGIGGIYVRDGVEIAQTRAGGTGVRSAYPFHLPEYPYRLEVGTVNLLGVAGLNAGQKYIAKRGLNNIHKEEMRLLDLFQQGLSEIDHITTYGTKSLQNRMPVLSLNIEGYKAFDTGILLDGDYDIAVRTGLHCAPKAHEQLGTVPEGSVRFGIGPMNTEYDILHAIEAVKELAPTRATCK